MKIKLRIPESLSEITLEQYQKFTKAKGDDEFMAHKALEIFCGIELKQVLYLPLSEIEDATQVIQRAFEESAPLVTQVTLNGVKYGFIPNLYGMTFGEYTDIEDNISDWDNMHKAMAVMYRPIDSTFGKLYNIQEYKGTAQTSEAMKHLPLNVVFGAVNFMYRLGIDLSRATLLSMRKDLMTQDSQPQKERSLNDGDGTHPSMPLLKAIHLGLSQFQNSITDSPIRISLTKLRSTT
jgi:hypothetical protein